MHAAQVYSDRSCVLLCGAPTARGELRRRPQHHADSSSRLIAAIHHLQVPAQTWAGASPASPGADVGDMRSVPPAMGAVPAQMWDGVSPRCGTRATTTCSQTRSSCWSDESLPTSAAVNWKQNNNIGELEAKQQESAGRGVPGQDPCAGPGMGGREEEGVVYGPLGTGAARADT